MRTMRQKGEVTDTDLQLQLFLRRGTAEQSMDLPDKTKGATPIKNEYLLNNLTH